MKLDLERTTHGRSELPVNVNLTLDWSEDKPAEVEVDGVLKVDNLDSRFLVNGPLRAQGKATCGRCLENFRISWKVPVEVVVLRDLETDEGEGNTIVLRKRRGEVDLDDALRESVILAFPPTVVCQESCKGLCPNCGVDLNHTTCTCQEDDYDPRWAGLDALED